MLQTQWLLRKLKRSLIIVIEGVAIATCSLIVLIVFAIPYGVYGITRWTADRVINAWMGDTQMPPRS